MRTITFSTFLLALPAILCSSVIAETGAQVHVFRRPASAFDATLDLLVREHQDIVVNAYANVLTSSEFKTDIASHLKVTTRYVRSNRFVGSTLPSHAMSAW